MMTTLKLLQNVARRQKLFTREDASVFEVAIFFHGDAARTCDRFAALAMWTGFDFPREGVLVIQWNKTDLDALDEPIQQQPEGGPK